MMADDLDYLADFHAPFHDLRGAKEHADGLAADDYTASQALAAQLLKQGSAGIVYRSVRRGRGTCIVCFRPVLVTNVRQGDTFTFTFPVEEPPPKIRRA